MQEPENFRLGYQPQPCCRFRAGFKIPISMSRFKPEEPIPSFLRNVLKKTNSPIIKPQKIPA